MATSSVERDLALMLFQSGGTKDLEEKLQKIVGKSGIQGAKNFYEVMAKKREELEKIKKSYEDAYKNFKDILTKYGFFDEEASAVITQIAKYSFREVGPLNLAKDLFGITDTNNLVAQTVNKEALSFLSTVNSYFDQIVDSYDFLSMVGEEIRGDTLLYAIAQTGKKSSSNLTILGKEAYSQLLKNNKHMFNLKIEDDGQVSELEISRAGRQNLDFALQSLVDNTQINSIFTSQQQGKNLVLNLMNSTIKEGSEITYRDIWHQIKATTNLMSAKNIEGKQFTLDMGRKFELFMQADFSKISGNSMRDSTTIQEIQDIINSFNGKISMGENKSGLAGGDTSFTLPNNGPKITIQDKIANNATGWNGIGVPGLFNGFDFYIYDMPKLIKDVNQNPEKFNNGDYITQYVTENYMGGATYEDTAYQTMGSLVMETLSSDPNFEVWLSDI